mmetsp:Transcript_12658/g.12296  ORF Transcript_12658/g.12296 Transcript_12658/m.12296 type:complete len:599 (-) Transcript_12658:68-1864(-)|eukprot:CAMPEP_0119037822 /NCGR_PEP_ID=MMETSP1177-20130426/6330_1 /TAXON_ID=2985 /ORGANISM="Ochromonas sp, Strain CCMP1899" /LENGTH=598 /DNA_ID=CAMNT_0006999537 /DNA_START=83 /DNA_END=1879 /DNA_ORIENTATION=-
MEVEDNMEDADDNLFGSDQEGSDGEEELIDSGVIAPLMKNEKEEGTKEEKVEVTAEELFGSDNDEKEEREEVTAEGLFGSDDDEAEEKGAGDDGKSRFTDRQQDLDDLFGVKEESSAEALVPVVQPITVSKLCLGERVALKEDSIAIRMPNFVKIAPTCFEPETLDVDEELKALGGAATIIRWRYKRDENGEIEIGNDGLPQRESNARLVKLVNGTYKLLVGEATFDAVMNNTEKRYAYVQTKSAMDPDDPHCDVETKDDTVLECAGVISQQLVLRPEKGASNINNRNIEAIKDKYGVKKEVKQMYENISNPITAQNARAKLEEEEIRREKKRKDNAKEGFGSGYKYTSSVRRPAMNSAYLDEANTDYDNVNISELKKSKGRDQDGKKRSKQKNEEEESGFIDSEDDEDVEEYFEQEEESDEEGEGEDLYSKKKGAKGSSQPADRDQKPEREQKEYVDDGGAEDDDESDDESFGDEDEVSDNSGDSEEGDEGEEGEDDDGEKKSNKNGKDKRHKDKSSSSKKDKKDKKEATSSSQKEKGGKRLKEKRSRDEEVEVEEEEGSTAGAEGGDIIEEGEDEEEAPLVNKRPRRMIVDSDDDE